MRRFLMNSHRCLSYKRSRDILNTRKTLSLLGLLNLRICSLFSSCICNVAFCSLLLVEAGQRGIKLRSKPYVTNASRCYIKPVIFFLFSAVLPHWYLFRFNPGKIYVYQFNLCKVNTYYTLKSGGKSSSLKKLTIG